MKTQAQICSFEIEKYAKKFTFGGFREGFHVHLKDTDGNEATGEIAPLPGRSLETLEEAYANLEQLKKNFLDNDLTPFPLQPSVMFGMQMAFYSLQNPKQTANPPMTKLYLEPPALFGSKGDVKLKLGHLLLDDAISFFNKFKRSEKNLRIDLERKWELEKTLEFCEKIDTSCILYIEDPVMTFSDLETFYKKTNVEYALDQFLSFAPPQVIKALKGLHSIIVKPSLCGGLHECRQLQELYAPIPISISSLFESSVGIEHIKLISSILCPDAPVGCDTLKFLQAT